MQLASLRIRMHTELDDPRRTSRTGRKHLMLPSLQTMNQPGTTVFIKNRKPLLRTTDAGGASNPLGTSSLSTSDCIRYHVDKPIVRTPRPQDFHTYLHQFKESSSNAAKTSLYERLLHRRLWTTTSEAANKESALPTPRPLLVPKRTLEQCGPDSVKCQQVHNFVHPMLWQRLGRQWDAFQIRDIVPALGRQKNDSINNFYAPVSPTSRVDGQYIHSKLGNKHSEKFNHRQYYRPISGYCGYVSYHPVPSQSPENDIRLFSTSRETYRFYPATEYRRLEYSVKTPMSKLITLTEPHTPFSRRS